MQDNKRKRGGTYKLLTCSTTFLDNKILIIISIPLLDQSDVYEIYHAYNLPLPLQRHGTNNDVYDIVAQYQIEANTLIAINKERTKCVLLTSDETLQCKNPVTGFCSIKSPIYSVNTNKFCITALFMKNAELIGPFCQTTVKMKTILPLAEYLSDGYWVITTNVNFRFSIVCRKSSTFSIDIKPPLQVIKLDMFCHAVGKMLIFPAYFHKESKYNINDPFDKLLRNSEHFNFNIWESFHENVPNYTIIK